MVAVTVLPTASLVANIWMKWYDFMKKVHTLMYIRHCINDKQQQRKQKEIKNKNEKVEQETVISPSLSAPPSQILEYCVGDENITISNKSDANALVNTLTEQQSREETTISTIASDNGSKTSTSATTATATATATKEFMYHDFDVIKYAKKSLGYIHEEVDIVAEFIDGMGAEEFNVFAVNYARKAGGLSLTRIKKSIDRYDLKLLQEKEKKIHEELKKSRSDLVEARNNIVKEYKNETLVDEEAPAQPLHAKSVNNVNEHTGDHIYEKGSSVSEDRSSIPNIRRRRGKRRSSWFTGDQLDLAIRKLDTMKENSEPIEKLHQMNDGLHSVGTKVKDEGEEGRAFLTDHIYPSYAVATFTSRYAAIIARQCLIDGGGTSAWRKVDDIPIYPLADSPPFMYFPSGFMYVIILHTMKYPL